MMNPEQHAQFPTMSAFLELLEVFADEAGKSTDKFMSEGGKKLPASVDGLGNVLSILYRAACCSWGCRGGDHQIEWLAGRIINQAMSAYRLIRSAYYDEALMLIRGIGELANLLWLFESDRNEMTNWQSATRRERLNQFGPKAVRDRLAAIGSIGAPIDDERYRRLCEVGTHPVPGFAPGHYTGTGHPILGLILQPVGVFVCVTELSFAVAMSIFPLVKLLDLPKEPSEELVKQALALVRSLGSFTILNYEDLLTESSKKAGESDDSS